MVDILSIFELFKSNLFSPSNWDVKLIRLCGPDDGHWACLWTRLGMIPSAICSAHSTRSSLCIVRSRCRPHSTHMQPKGSVLGYRLHVVHYWTGHVCWLQDWSRSGHTAASMQGMSHGKPHAAPTLDPLCCIQHRASPSASCRVSPGMVRASRAGLAAHTAPSAGSQYSVCAA